MSEPIKLPPFKWEMYQSVPAGPAIKMIEDYARLAVEQATAELRTMAGKWESLFQAQLTITGAAQKRAEKAEAERDVALRRLGQHDVCNGTLEEGLGYVPECKSLRDDRDALRAELARLTTLIYDEWSARVQGDLENGVNWLNKKAAEEWRKEYPEIAGFGKWLAWLADVKETKP